MNLSISVSHNNSSNVNEVIKTILDVFIQKLHAHKKAQTAYRRTKIKNALKNTSKSKKVTYSLICVFVLLPGRLCAFCAFAWLCVVFCVGEIFS